MSSPWPELPYQAWHATCDTLHAHTQVLGKLAAALAPPEPQLQHAALRLSRPRVGNAPAAGTRRIRRPCRGAGPAPPRGGGRAQRRPSHRIALAPDRPVAEVTRDVLAAVADLVGPVQIDPTPQETPWTTPLDEDYERATYNPAQATELPRRGHPGRPRACRATRPVPRALHAGQRLVGHLRPRREPVLRSSRRPAVQRLHHAELGHRPADRSRLVARRRPLPTARLLRVSRSRRQTDSTKPHFVAGRARAGTPSWASTSSTGTTHAAHPIRAKPPSTSGSQRSDTPAWCAAGTPPSPPAPKVPCRPSPERRSAYIDAFERHDLDPLVGLFARRRHLGDAPDTRGASHLPLPTDRWSASRG